MVPAVRVEREADTARFVRLGEPVEQSCVHRQLVHLTSIVRSSIVPASNARAASSQLDARCTRRPGDPRFVAVPGRAVPAGSGGRALVRILVFGFLARPRRAADTQRRAWAGLPFAILMTLILFVQMVAVA
jgi:hypothetical protein